MNTDAVVAELERALRGGAGGHGALDVLAEVTVLAVPPQLLLGRIFGELRCVVS